MDKGFLVSIRLENFLSFGPRTPSLELHPLNVLIGPNGSGKSNVFEAIWLLHSTPRDLAAAVLQPDDRVSEWVWKGSPEPAAASIEVVVEIDRVKSPLRYLLRFAERGQGFEIVEESLKTARPTRPDEQHPYIFFEVKDGRGVLNVRTEEGAQGAERKKRSLRPEDLEPGQSVLSQRKDPDHYPEITTLAQLFSNFRLYREWSFGRRAPPRVPQKTDLLGDFLAEDGHNLALVLNKLKRHGDVYRSIVKHLQDFYEQLEGIDTIVESGKLQVFFYERGLRTPLPATRLSDGTLRFLFLLTVLCHPKPPPLICL